MTVWMMVVGTLVAVFLLGIAVVLFRRDNPNGLTEVTGTEGQPKQLVAILTEKTARGALNEAWDAGFKLAAGLNRLNREQRRNIKKGYVQTKRAEKVELIADRLVGKGVEEQDVAP
jgi:hypothetical protein